MSTPRVGTLASPRLLQSPHTVGRPLLERARQCGLDHVFMADHVSFHGGTGMDGFVQAALVAGLVPDLHVVIGVYLLALRHPVPVARQIATFCEAAPGRLTLGVGVGGEDRHEIEVCGIDPRTRGRRTDAALTALRGLLGGEPYGQRDEFFDFEAACIRPAPNPAVPIWIGGRSSAAVVRTARYGDGWLATWVSPRRMAESVREIEDRAREAGRNVVWQHGLQIWVGIDADRERARAHLARGMEAMYRIPFERFERYCAWGTPGEVADFLAPYVEAGCSVFNVMPVAASAEAEVDAVAEIRERLVR